MQATSAGPDERRTLSPSLRTVVPHLSQAKACAVEVAVDDADAFVGALGDGPDKEPPFALDVGMLQQIGHATILPRQERKAADAGRSPGRVGCAG